MKNKYLYLTVLIVVAIFIAGLLLYLRPKPQAIDMQTFNSTRVALSFEYPDGFPVKAIGSEYENNYIDEDTIEHISFTAEKTVLPNSGSDSYGYIVVSKIEIDSLEKYIDEQYSNECILSKTLIEYKSNYIQNGYRVNKEDNPKCGGILGPNPKDKYYFYENGYLIETALSNPEYLNSTPQEITRIYEEIILPSMILE